MASRPRSRHAVVVMFALAVGAFATPTLAHVRPAASAAVCKRKPKAKVKPPKRDKCREQCQHRNRIADCAHQDGNRVPCPCHCP